MAEKLLLGLSTFLLGTHVNASHKRVLLSKKRKLTTLKQAEPVVVLKQTDVIEPDLSTVISTDATNKYKEEEEKVWQAAERIKIHEANVAAAAAIKQKEEEQKTKLIDKETIVEMARQIQLRGKDHTIGSQPIQLSTPHTQIELNCADEQIRMHSQFNDISLENTGIMLYRLGNMYAEATA